MKIAFLLQSFPCLSETFILNQITGLIDSGCDVRIIAFRKAADQKLHPDIVKYNLLNKTIYLDVPGSKTSKRLKAAYRTWIGFIRHPVFTGRLYKYLPGRYHSFSYPRLFLGLACIHGDFDAILCHYGPVGNQAIWLKDIGLRADIAVVFHGYDLSVYLKQEDSSVYQELFTKGNWFLPISHFWKQTLIRLGCPENKIVVHHMGVNSQKITYRKKYYQKGSPLKCLTVARLVEKKGLMYALQAVAELIRENYPIRYQIAGDGPLREPLEKKAAELNISEHVFFLGAVDQSEVLGLYEQADCFLLPSIVSESGDMEGIPVVLMESMAAGLPVITTCHSGIPELVQDNKTGFLVPEKSTQALKNKLEYLINHYDVCSEISKNAREMIMNSFEINPLNKTLVKLLCRE